MIFALLGDIKIGDAVLTGPSGVSETQYATLVEHQVARGKPPIQDMGDELLTKRLEFFFDETFCNPQVELLKLQAAFKTRTALAYVAGNGAFHGVRWIIESLDVTTLKTTPFGRPTRLKISVSMKEVAGFGLMGILIAAARATAISLRGSSGSSIGSRK
jgi:hypothetical protein